MSKIACCIFSYEITKGMKSYGSIGLLKSNNKAKELIYHAIRYIKSILHTKNIFVLVGFDEEKIIKKLKEHNLFYNNTISNNLYNDKNHGYAFKLSIEKIFSANLGINGVLFINGSNIIKKLPQYSTKESWILIDKKHKNPRFNIGCFIEDNYVQHLFYNLSDSYWAEAVYFTMDDLKKIYDKIDDLYYDNMFMFEIINTAIEKQAISFKAIYNQKVNNIIKINGLKDKHKIR